MSIENFLGLKLRAAYLSFHRRAQATLAPHGLTADQFVILTLLANEDGVRQRDLVDATASDSSTIGAMLKLLEERGLVERIPCDADRRSMRVYLTTRGLELQHRLRDIVAPIRQDLLDAVPTENRESVAAALSHIADVMQAASPSNGDGKGA